MKKLIPFLFFLFFLSGVTLSQWSSNNLVNNTVCTAPNNQLSVKTISDGDGGIIMIWEDRRFSTSNRDIYAQRIDKFGFKQWGDSNGIFIANKPDDERYFDLCSDGKGGAFFVWDFSLTPTVTYLKVQRVSKTGSKLFSDTGYVAAFNGNRQSQAKISSDNSGGFYMAYYTSEILSTDYEIKANRFDSLGNKLWGNGVFVCQSDGNPAEMSVCTTTNNEFIACWGDWRNSILTESDLYIQKLNSSGVPQWTTNGIALIIKKFSQQYQKVFPDNSGGAYITWCDRRDSISNDIYLQRIRPNGSLVFADTALPITFDNFEQYQPQLAQDMKGGIYVTWYDFRNGPEFPFNIDVYAQRVDSAGVRKWSPNGNNISNAQYSQVYPAIISDGNFGALITWDDRRAGTTTYDIYAQRVDSSGNLLWDTTDVAISISSGNQYKPQIVPTNSGALICFEDTRNGSNNYDLFIQKVMMNGSTVLKISNKEIIPEGFRLAQNYPNPFNPTTNIQFSVSGNNLVILKVYDITGKLISTLVSQNLNAGTYNVDFDASKLTSGIYFYRLISGDFSDVKKMVLIR